MNEVYSFGAFALDPKRRELTKTGTPVPVTAKAFDILHYLLRHPKSERRETRAGRWATMSSGVRGLHPSHRWKSLALHYLAAVRGMNTQTLAESSLTRDAVERCFGRTNEAAVRSNGRRCSRYRHCPR